MIPDVPDAVLGWRTWRVGRRAQQRHALFAPMTGTPWPPARPMVASCASPRHTPPGDVCPCGLYGVADPGELGWSPSDHEVLGVVALWGDVVEGALGWRASHGYPRFLVTGPGISEEQRGVIARRYGVPVHRGVLAPRTLAGLLGADRATADTLRRGTDPEVTALLAARSPEWARRAEHRRAVADGHRREHERRTARWGAWAAWLPR